MLSEVSVVELWDSAPCGFLSTLPDGTITQVNATFLAWTGHSRAALLAGQRFQDLLTVSGRIYYETHFAPLLLMQGFVKEIACQIKRESREPLQVLINSSLELDADGQPQLIRTIVFDATDRAKYEGELRRTRNEARQLAAIVSSSSDAIISAGLDAVVHTWNPGAVALFGYSEAEAVGKSVDELVVPEHLQATRREKYERVGSGETVVFGDTVRRRKDGSLVSVEIIASPMRDGEGRVTAASLIFRDITERQHAQKLLRDSERKMRLGIRVAGVGLATVDYRQETVVLDETAAQLFALSPNQPLPRSEVHSRIHPDDAELVFANIAKGLDPAGDGTMSCDHRILRPDGSVVWIAARKQVDFVTAPDGARQPSTALLAVLDISERRLAEAELRDSEQRMALAAETTRLGIWEWNPTSNRIRWDAQMFRIYGVPPTHDGFVDYETWRSAVVPEDLAQNEDVLNNTVQRNGRSAREFRILRADTGESRTIHAVEAIRVDSPGNKWVVGTNVDITERKRSEEQIRLLMGEVNHRAKNLLAVVQAIARQTARLSDPSTFAIKFSERLRGLAISQDLLVRNQWRSVDAAELVRAQLSHFGDLIGTRVLFDGHPIRLSPRAAQGIGMALHELATNAAKYGALSNASGRVHVNWTTVEGLEHDFTMQWLEEDGPEVVRPRRNGFGHIVVGRMVEASVGGKVDIEYRKSGLCWKLATTSANLSEPEAHEQ